MKATRLDLRPTCVALSSNLLAALDLLARSENNGRSAVVRRLLTRALEAEGAFVETA